MYGTNSDQDVPLVTVHKPEISSNPTSVGSNNSNSVYHFEPTDPFNETLDQQFWKEVSSCLKEENERREKNGNEEVSRRRVEMRLRLNKITKHLKDNDDPENDQVAWLIVTKHDELIDSMGSNNQVHDAVMNQLSEFVIMLLEEDFHGHPSYSIDDINTAPNNGKRKYEDIIPLPTKPNIRASVLHLAAERNLCKIAEVYLKLYPHSIVYDDDPGQDKFPPPRKRKAVEYALDKNKDSVCAYLMKRMRNFRVRALFESHGPESEGYYSFVELIKKPMMKQTVLCVLDSCINQNLPFLRKDRSEKRPEGAEIWSNPPNTANPLQYDLFFQILDGDIGGRPAKNQKEEINPHFLHKSPSALQVIANSATTNRKQQNLDPIGHPVVRLLVRSKWKNYGLKAVRTYCGMYIFFLLMLSIALILGAMSNNPSDYPHTEDQVRGFCEVVTLIFTIFYFGTELEQCIKEFEIYRRDINNWVDLAGLLSIIILLPFRFGGLVTTTRSISVATYFINFMRMYKFFPIKKEFSIYAKTYLKILTTDIVMFMFVFVFVMLAFTGSIFIAIIASSSLDDNFSNYWHVFLQELRAISEGKEFADSYSPYNAALVLFILFNMFSIIVVLSNILIGQLSYRYELAMKEAELQYDIDKAKLVTSIERSWFKKHNKRIKHYKKGMFTSEKELKSLFVEWNKQSSSDETDEAITEMVDKKILKR